MLALAIAPPVGAESVIVVIEGLSEELTEAIRAGLELQRYVGRDVTAAQIRRLFARADQQIEQALEPYGYYNPRVESQLEPIPDGFRAEFRVTPGEPVIIREANVRVIGPGSDHPDVQAALNQFEPRVGGRLDHASYERSKSSIENVLLANGYLDAKLLTHRVEVTRRSNSANIDLSWQTGQRYRLGPVDFSSSQFSEEFLQRFIPWEEGAYYSSDRLLLFQERLVSSNYFSTVAVQPVLAKAEDGVVPIDVVLIPARRNAYLASVFYGTDSGAGVSAIYERRWMNRRGHKLRTETEYSQRLQSMTASYAIPLPGPNDRSYNFGVQYRDENTDTSQSRSVRAVANETREWRGFTRVVGLQYFNGDFEVASERHTTSLLFPELVLSRQAADDLRFPLRGNSLSLTVRATPESWLSDTSVLQARVDAKWIRSLSERQRFILRGSLGGMVVDDFSQLPPELRFFAGGDRSIRGFDYQSIGTLNGQGEVIGGKQLVVASAEYEYYFLQNWGAATFVDAGDAYDSGSFMPRVGVGVGVRWRSPVGLVRVDFARPVAHAIGSADGIRFHVMIGPDL